MIRAEITMEGRDYPVALRIIGTSAVVRHGSRGISETVRGMGLQIQQKSLQHLKPKNSSLMLDFFLRSASCMEAFATSSPAKIRQIALNTPADDFILSQNVTFNFIFGRFLRGYKSTQGRVTVIETIMSNQYLAVSSRRSK